MGRKSTFNAKDAAEIIERLMKGEPLAHICADDWLPAVRTVSDWTAAHETFAADFARARDVGFDAIAADCLKIADSPNATTDKDGNIEVRDPQRDRLRVDTRLKLLSKWDPKRYGDKLAHVGGDENDAPIKTELKISFV